MSYRGINLLVIGNPVYMCYAANMMISIKAHCPDLKINMIAEGKLVQHIPAWSHLWDIFTEIDPVDCYNEGGRIDPGRAKVSMYPYLWKHNKWEECVYLDVDGIVLRDLDKLFDYDESVVFKCQKDQLHWADINVVKEHFGVPQEAELFGLNSSYQFIRKSPQAELLFNEAKDAMLNNPLPIKQMQNNWFNNQPDELYYSIGMYKAGIVDPYPEFGKFPVYFRTRHSYGEVNFTEDIEGKHFVMGCYGGERYNHKSIARLYDKLVQRNAQKFRQNTPFKYHNLMERKHKY